MKFTIATPSFNSMDWLPCCIASVADQVRGKPDPDMLQDPDWPEARAEIDVEHIIQDGGSENWDSFLRKLERRRQSYVGQEPDPDTLMGSGLNGGSGYELQLLSEPDLGMYDAINKAWRRGTGEIFTYLNADEQYLPQTLRTVSRVFHQNPDVDVIFGDAIIINESAAILSYRRMVTPSRLHTRAVHLGVMSCSMFFRKRVLDEIGWLDGTLKAIGDAEWIYRLLDGKLKVKMLPEPLAAFGLTGNNLGVNNIALKEAERWRSGLSPLELKLIPVLKLQHWMKKLLAGAYAKRHVKTGLYLPGKATVRQDCERLRTPHRWMG